MIVGKDGDLIIKCKFKKLSQVKTMNNRIYNLCKLKVENCPIYKNDIFTSDVMKSYSKVMFGCDGNIRTDWVKYIRYCNLEK